MTQGFNSHENTPFPHCPVALYTTLLQSMYIMVNGADGGDFSLADSGAPALTPLIPDQLDFHDDGTNELAIWNPLLTLQNQSGSLYSQSNLEFFDIDDNGSIEIMGLAQSKMVSVGDYLLLLNDGTGTFTRAEPGAYFPASAQGNGFDIEVADFDGDGLDDMFFCNRASAIDSPVESGGMAVLLRGINP